MRQTEKIAGYETLLAVFVRMPLSIFIYFYWNPTMSRRSVSFFFTLFATCFVSVAHAADSQVPKSKQAVTDLNMVDEDFEFQGEYAGLVLTGEQTWQPIGLQVVALGDGKFHAVENAGGLPGAGGRGRYRFKMEGQRDGDSVKFVAEPLQVTVVGGQAKFYLNSIEKEIASLNKIQRVSPTSNAPAPAGAIVLFDGTNTDHFKNAKKTEDGLLMMGTQTKRAFNNFKLHLEFRLPYMPHARGQGRANSGVYLQSRYEVQILDSFGLEGKHNECGGLYRERQPDLNMCFPPLSWQTYDIEFHAPKFDKDGAKTDNVRLTVRHNGVLIHDNFELPKKTGGGNQEGPQPLPTKLQDHNNPVVFRNIWLVELDDLGRSMPSESATEMMACDCCETRHPKFCPLRWLGSFLRNLNGNRPCR